MRQSRLKQPQEMILCECGCNTLILKYNANGKLRRFAAGHQTRFYGISEAQRRKISASLKGHPSFLKSQTPEARAKISLAVKGRRYDEKAIESFRAAARKRSASPSWSPPQNGGLGKQGIRDDLKHRFRSSWEANIARLLNRSAVEWQYESVVFTMSDGTSYRPDFYLPKQDIYIEVKGWWRPENLRRYLLFRQEYPSIRIALIDKDRYLKIARFAKKIIPTWE